MLSRARNAFVFLVPPIAILLRLFGSVLDVNCTCIARAFRLCFSPSFVFRFRDAIFSYVTDIRSPLTEMIADYPFDDCLIQRCIGNGNSDDKRDSLRLTTTRMSLSQSQDLSS